MEAPVVNCPNCGKPVQVNAVSVSAGKDICRLVATHISTGSSMCLPMIEPEIKRGAKVPTALKDRNG